MLIPTRKSLSVKTDGIDSISKRSFLRTVLGASVLGLTARSAMAAQVGVLKPCNQFNCKISYSQDQFLADVFGGAVPAPGAGNSGSVSSQARLLVALPGRVRYWRANGKTVWVIDEIGKEGYAPTKAAFVVKDGAIESSRIIEYREARGEQVGSPSFLQQFVGAKLSGGGLNKQVSNIAGATYSVQQMQRMAAAALLLNQLNP